MPEFAMRDVDPIHYLCVESESGMDPQSVGEAMGKAFGRVMEFMQHHGIPPAGQPIAIYSDYDPKVMRFRAGVPVAADDTRAAERDIVAGTTPSGKVLHFTHIGPYATLRDSYGAMMAHCEAQGLKVGAPAWEVYVDDPFEVPEERLRTEVYCVVD